MSWGEKPVYCQMTLTTGMSMLGKMSVGVLEMTTGARMNSINDRTTNVYGRRNARRTIHIDFSCRRLLRNTDYRPRAFYRAAAVTAPGSSTSNSHESSFPDRPDCIWRIFPV